MRWPTLRRNRKEAGPAERALVLTAAYKNTFSGNATKSEAEMVLADLAVESGFMAITSVDLDSYLPRQEGKRELFARIWSYINLSADEEAAIQEAVREEQAALESGDYP